jgi:hypothetical protein
MGGRVGVGVLAAGEEVQGLVERRLHVGRGALRDGELRFGAGDLADDAVLLLVEEVEGDRALVVGVQELGSLVGELGEPALLAGGLVAGLANPLRVW